MTLINNATAMASSAAFSAAAAVTCARVFAVESWIDRGEIANSLIAKLSCFVCTFARSLVRHQSSSQGKFRYKTRSSPACAWLLLRMLWNAHNFLFVTSSAVRNAPKEAFLDRSDLKAAFAVTSLTYFVLRLHFSFQSFLIFCKNSLKQHHVTNLTPFHTLQSRQLQQSF